MKIKLVEKHEYVELLNKYFPTDEELYTKWHIASENGLDGCIHKTLEDFKNVDSSFKLFEVENMGFFGIEYGNYLTTIFVHPEYRKKEYIKEFWNLIEVVMINKPFYAGLYKKNTRCHDFYLKNGGKVILEEQYGNHSVQMFRFEEK